jgi:hypothetical protein
MKNISDIKELLALSGRPTSIPDNLMAFFLFLKKIKHGEKNDEFNAFAMNSNELECLAEIINQMVEKCYDDVRFQIAFSKWDGSAQLNHWSFLEFKFQGPLVPPSLDILVCDPLGFNQSVVLTNLLSSKIEFGRLSELCRLSVYIPSDILQISGRGCAYFVTDSISMLSNQDKFSPIYTYMNAHQQELQTKRALSTLHSFREVMAFAYSEEELNDMYEFNIVVSSLPTRLLRTQQSVATLEKEIFESEERGTEIVNGKGETALKSIQNHSFFVMNRKQEHEYRNMRVNIKMEKLGKNISEISSEMVAEEEIHLFNEAVQENRLAGLAKIVDQVIDKKQVVLSL